MSQEHVAGTRSSDKFAFCTHKEACSGDVWQSLVAEIKLHTYENEAETRPSDMSLLRDSSCVLRCLHRRSKNV